MKQINKTKPPASLIEHSKKGNADYDNYLEKDDLRKSLHEEQRGICCYCMCYIEPNIQYMKIEHFKCQENYPKEQLKYPNLLAACKGNEGEKEKYTHCDTFKGNKQLSIYPPGKIPNVDTLFEYNNDGSISSKNKKYDSEINSVLNLNTLTLMRNRKARLDGFKDSLKIYKGEIKKPTIQKWINKWKGTSHQDNLQPYCMVIVYWLQKRLNRA